MSSFKAKVAKVEKQKSALGGGKNVEVQPTSSPVQYEQEGRTDITSTQAPTATVLAEALYGEDQHEDGQEKPRFERTIPLDRIRPNPFQPRKTFDQDKLEELAAGMKVHGWIGGGLPVRAHSAEANVYELVWGERRWRAARMAGLTAIPCVVSVYSDDDMIEKGLLENIQRENLSTLEEGLAYVSLLALRTETGKPRYSIRRLAAQIGKDKSYIEDRLKYARVPIDIQQLAEDQPDISPRIIRELGELSKILQPAERAPVIEGVRAGKLRIEDVREIRQDIEQALQQQQTELVEAAAPEPVSITPTREQSGEGYSSHSVQPASSPASVATDTLLSMEEDALAAKQEPIQPAAPRPMAGQTVDGASSFAPATPLTPTIVISVFEKSLKRDHEAIDRILQRVAATMTSLTAAEQAVLIRYLQRWNGSIESLIQQLEPTQAEPTELIEE